MLDNKAKSNDFIGAALALAKPVEEGVGAGGVYTLQCFDKEGVLKWEASSPNLVVNVGLKDMNDKYFTGSTYTAAWFVGLITGPGSGTTFAAGDTAASHAGWTENVGYSNATRPSATFGAATTADPSEISNSASPASFNINATSVIAGAFLISNNTKGGTTGVLFSASDFQSPGDRSVVSGDTLNVTYTFNLDAV
jgi:nucleoid-associated protein YgaU